MNSCPHHSETGTGPRRRFDGIALVITLLMLSVITFLAVAFLAMTQRNRADVGGTLDVTTARAMSDAAAARAQGEILAQMLAHQDAYFYDYMVSRNYITPGGFNNSLNKVYDPTNVNYDFIANGAGGTPFLSSTYSVAWVQNIANLFYDPRPPVFVQTIPGAPLDFRFYVDINRNGRFETNGYIPTITNEILPTQGGPPLGPYALWNGEPEFIGVLANPLYPHSFSNHFVGRYAYMVLPIGKEPDINFIHNFAKANYMNIPALTNGSGLEDGFARSQGVGSYELNLAALLDALSPWAYESNDLGYVNYEGFITNFSRYNYTVPLNGAGTANTGSAFDDAESILHYRDWEYNPPLYLATLNNSLVSNGLPSYWGNIDYYCIGGLTNLPFDYGTSTNSLVTYPWVAQSGYANRSAWPGSYGTNLFFDPQDLFDPAKTSPSFINRMLVTSGRTNFNDRYTFQRLLSCVGMGSSPEYGVWVYPDYNSQTNPYPPSQTALRTKVNLNYDNTFQITNTNAPYAPMPTNLIAWTPLGFFTNAAELLLRSQPYSFYVITNFNGTNYTNLTPVTNCFGVTDIPIYRTNNPGIRYDTSIHRMLQLAANIYDATNPTNLASAGTAANGSTLPPVRHPAVFRPVFQIVNAGTTNVGLNISGYVQVTNATDAWPQILKGFQDVTNSVFSSAQFQTFDTNGNVAGIPWVVAANKGLPEFYHYTCESQILYARKMLFPRQTNNGVIATNLPVASTNQFYCFGITNTIGMDAWNSYTNRFYGSTNLYYFYSNYVTVQLTNEYNFGYPINGPWTLILTNPTGPVPLNGGFGPATGVIGSTNGFLTIYKNTNIVLLPDSYYSTSRQGFVFLTNGVAGSNSFLAADMGQTGWPAYNWTLNVTNHVVYALFDGPPSAGGALLDFVNIAPFGSSLSITNVIENTNNPNGGLGATGSKGTSFDYWDPAFATSFPNSPLSRGALNQMTNGELNNADFGPSLLGKGTNADAVLECPVVPIYVINNTTNLVANDPLVHYTLDDLVWMGDANEVQSYDLSSTNGSLLLHPIPVILTNSVGMVSPRYAPWGASDTIGNNILFKDPLITNSSLWQFPTNKFPGVGWIGRVHRGTPWQTVYLKADPSPNWAGWSNWANPYWVTYPNVPETYPTIDWALVDLFTTAPNDNAARGLLSVNQTNYAAWAAAFAGIVAVTNGNGGRQIYPSEAVTLAEAINAQRTNQPNGIFHKIGDILAAPALTTTNGSPFLEPNFAGNYTDADYERIPQQTLSLLRVGEPQFAIYTWGQALKPSGVYVGGGPNQNICTNYQITGEYLSRTVCHLVYSNGPINFTKPKIVIDSYNVEPAN